MGLFGGGSGAKKEAKRARLAEQERQRDMRVGRARIDKILDRTFSKDYFTQLKSTARAHYLPQLQDQYRDAKSAMLYSLARSGNTFSSTAADQSGRMAQEHAGGLKHIETLANDLATKQRANVEATRDTLYGQVGITADPNLAQRSAINAATIQSRPATFDPLTSLFKEAYGYKQIYDTATEKGFRGWGGTWFGPSSNPNKSVQIGS